MDDNVQNGCLGCRQRNYKMNCPMAFIDIIGMREGGERFCVRDGGWGWGVGGDVTMVTFECMLDAFEFCMRNVQFAYWIWLKQLILSSRLDDNYFFN